MTPKKQVSPAIRISQEERDASARATHLEAATRKFLLATNERKYMSKTINFKRTALVAVVALGLGLISSIPSQGAVTSLTVTATNSTSASTTKSDSTTASTLAITALNDAAWDTVTVQLVPRSGTTAKAYLVLADTSVVNTLVTYSASCAVSVPTRSGTISLKNSATDSVTSTVPAGCLLMNYDTQGATATTGYIGATFRLFMESTPATTFTADTYGYTAIVKAYDGGAINTTKTITRDIDYTITASATELATASKVVSIGASAVILASSAANAGTSLTSTDSSISVVATASATDHAVVRVMLRNGANSTNAQESVTATITAGRVGISGGAMGRSVTVPYTSTDVSAGYKDLVVQADGTAGAAVLTVSVPSGTFASKTINFYASAPASLVATVATPNLKVGTNDDALRVTALDANGLKWTGTLYVYASTAADAVIAGSNATPVSCSFDTTDQRHECSVQGNSAGTAKLKVINTSTVAAATVTSNEVSAVVNVNTAATVKISFDKATYAPNERARIYVTPLDKDGKTIAANTFTNLLASGGITASAGITPAGTTTADSLTAVTMATSANASSSTGTLAGTRTYNVYMPAAGGVVTISATGGTALPAAGQVAITATATVTDSGAQALAAVTSLATTVASLKTLITTLTNLVLKIQKKVKA